MAATHPGSDRTGCRMTCGARLGGASGATSGKKAETQEVKNNESEQSCTWYKTLFYTFFHKLDIKIYSRYRGTVNAVIGCFWLLVVLAPVGIF